MMQENKLNILLLPRWYPNKFCPDFGIFVKEQSEAIAEECKVSVIYIHNFSDKNKKFDINISEENNVFTLKIYYNTTKIKIPIIKDLINIYRFYKANFLGYKIVCKNKFKPDIVHVHVLTRLGLFALYLKIFKNIPYLITEHWSRYFKENDSYNGFLRKYFTRIIVRKSSAVVAVSQKLKDAMKSKNLDNKIFLVIPNLVSIPKFISTSEKNKKKKILLSVGDLVEKTKNIKGVIKAVNIVKEKYSDFEYHIIGGGIDRKMLETYAENLGLLNKFIFFHGTQTHDYVYDFMKKADFFILNSNIETFSLVCAEALANAIPVIATKCGGPESFVNKDNGLLIEKNNESELVEAILFMMKNHDKFDKEKIFNSVNKKFDKDSFVKKYIELYSMIKNKKL